MTWYGLVNATTGDLVSVGTETMFEGGTAPQSGTQYQGYDVLEFGETGPNWSTLQWQPSTRTVVPRPAPVLISRLDDIEAWLQADPDWLAVWNTLSQARRTQIRTGLRRILNRVMGPQQWRGESETVEL
jgi:hypothetical protein